jgi:possible NADPH:quinone reductase
MTMHQVQLTVWGEPENLHFTETPMPSPLRGHVLLKVTAASVNPIDLTTRKGLGPAASLINLDQEPAVLGWDVAGLVCETAGDYTGFQPGEKVFGLVQFPHPGKTYAEYVLAPAHQLVHAPADIPMSSWVPLPWQH